MSLVQMFNLMQDGGPTVSKETNRIVYPARKNVTICTALSKYKQLGDMEAENEVKMEETD